MKRPVALDLSRLFIGAAGPTPRGIDRIDMGYAKHFLSAPDTANVGLVPSVRRMGLLTGRQAHRMAQTVEGHWQEHRPIDHDTAYGRLVRWLAGQRVDGVTQSDRVTPTALDTAARYLRLLGHARASVLRGAAGGVPRDALYLNVGQVLLGWPWFFGWLDRRPDVKVVLMMHDLIPVLYPEYSGPVLARHHGRAVRTLARRASGVIATSHASADELRDAVARLGRRDLPLHVVALPVDASFLKAEGGAGPPGPHYVVTVGIIDQRKNHRMLLHVWRDMIRAGVPDIPKLVVVGSRGLRTTELCDLIDRSPDLSDHVIEVNGLASLALRDVIRGARAVLMPSFTEGFGLPIVEALSLGTPVIASDIPAHREVGGSRAILLDPLDAPGWRDAILRVAAEPPQASPDGAAAGGYRPQTWSTYFGEVQPFLASL